MTKRKKQTPSVAHTSVATSTVVASRAAGLSTSEPGKLASVKKAKTERLPTDSLFADPKGASVQTAAEDVDLDDLFKKARAKKQLPTKPEKVNVHSKLLLHIGVCAKSHSLWPAESEACK